MTQTPATKTVLITGCSTGLGRTAALLFADSGWNVVATMRRPDPKLASTHPERILVEALDVADPESIEAALAAGAARFGGIDAVVNNAGITMLSVIETTPDAAIGRIFDTNVFGAIRVMRAAIPYLRRRGGGTIVNVSSGVGIAAMPLLSIYSASKQALEGLSESLSYELESQGIRIKLIEPGPMRNTAFAATGMAASAEAPVPEGYRAFFDHALAAMIDYPFPASPEDEVAAAILRAAGDTSTRLRYPVGPDAEEYARLRWTTSEEEYRAGMARLTGLEAWRAKTTAR
ncbi:SDR family oxidoreductase [Pseudomonas sp. R2.Fl]|nr:SDR family oxidoreductase [Pseudomonas sp. R2.Fl]